MQSIETNTLKLL